MITYNDTLEAGEEIICIGGEDRWFLTNGKRYRAVNGLQEGMFPTQPYVTVIADHGKEVVYHASRFKKLTPED